MVYRRFRPGKFNVNLYAPITKETKELRISAKNKNIRDQRESRRRMYSVYNKRCGPGPFQFPSCFLRDLWDLSVAVMLPILSSKENSLSIQK